MFAFYLYPDAQEDQDKLRMLYEEYRNVMFHVANRILRDEALAEDAVHTAFTRIIPNIHKIGEISCHKTKGYVIVIVENVAKQMYNQRKKDTHTSIEEWESMIPDSRNVQPDYAVINQLELEAVVRHIKALPDIYRDVLLLKYFHNLTDNQVSKALDVTVATVRKRLERARAKLVSQMEKEEASDAKTKKKRQQSAGKTPSGAGSL